MSKTNNADQPVKDQPDITNAAGTDPAGRGAPDEDKAGNDKPKADQKNEAGVLTIEEHAKNLNIDKPVFAAVMQSENWAGGKRVPEAVFKKAVDGFLNAPMGGTE